MKQLCGISFRDYPVSVEYMDNRGLQVGVAVNLDTSGMVTVMANNSNNVSTINKSQLVSVDGKHINSNVDERLRDHPDYQMQNQHNAQRSGYYNQTSHANQSNQSNQSNQDNQDNNDIPKGMKGCSVVSVREVDWKLKSRRYPNIIKSTASSAVTSVVEASPINITKNTSVLKLVNSIFKTSVKEPFAAIKLGDTDTYVRITYPERLVPQHYKELCIGLLTIIEAHIHEFGKDADFFNGMLDDFYSNGLALNDQPLGVDDARHIYETTIKQQAAIIKQRGKSIRQFYRLDELSVGDVIKFQAEKKVMMMLASVTSIQGNEIKAVSEEGTLCIVNINHIKEINGFPAGTASVINVTGDSVDQISQSITNCLDGTEGNEAVTPRDPYLNNQGSYNQSDRTNTYNQNSPNYAGTNNTYNQNSPNYTNTDNTPNQTMQGGQISSSELTVGDKIEYRMTGAEEHSIGIIVRKISTSAVEILKEDGTTEYAPIENVLRVIEKAEIEEENKTDSTISGVLSNFNQSMQELTRLQAESIQRSKEFAEQLEQRRAQDREEREANALRAEEQIAVMQQLLEEMKSKVNGEGHAGTVKDPTNEELDKILNETGKEQYSNAEDVTKETSINIGDKVLFKMMNDKEEGEVLKIKNNSYVIGVNKLTLTVKRKDILKVLSRSTIQTDSEVSNSYKVGDRVQYKTKKGTIRKGYIKEIFKKMDMQFYKIAHENDSVTTDITENKIIKKI